MKTIVVTGPESTGKTAVSAYLAEALNCPWVPEYAREYIGSLTRTYTYDDLLHITESQISQKKEAEKSNPSILVLDTWLIITKVWFIEVFNEYPECIDQYLANHRIDLYLICLPDIPWVPDPLRENGGEKRNYLLKRYMEEIKNSGSEFVLIGGADEKRYANALNAVKHHLKLSQ